MQASDVEGIPTGPVSAFGDLENRIMSDIVRRIQINASITRSADWQITRLVQLGQSKQEIKKAIQHALDMSDEAIERIYAEAVKTEYIRNTELYKAVGQTAVSFADNIELQSLMEAVKKQTKDEFLNISKSLGFVTQENGKLKALDITQFYQKTLDAAIGDISSGSFSYSESLRRTVKDMTNSGLRWIDYESGYHNRVTVAARRATMTGFNQTMSHINEKTAKDLGTNSFEITWHAGAREDHQWFQGKVFTKKELIDQCGLGTVSGLKGANCMHDYLPFVVGASVRTYTDAQLEKMNAEENIPKKYNGKEYTTSEALQRQRQLETNMRAQRQEISLLKQGGGDPLDIQNAMSRYKGSSAEYTGLSKAMGLPQQRERVTIDGLGRANKADSTNQLNNALDKSKIIKKDPLYPDEIAGVSRGNPMTIDEANHGKPNPNYGKESGYRINCQSCVVTYEARLRGYDVQTLPKTTGSQLDVLSRKTNKAWIDPLTGDNPKYIYDADATTPKKFAAFLSETIEKGKRYTLEFSWKGRSNSGHIISMDRDDENLIRLYDPQTGKTYAKTDVMGLLGDIKYVFTTHGIKIPVFPKILRVDDKQFNLEIVNEIMKGVEP